jgi:TolB-like protein
VALRRKSFEVLQYLIEHPERVVSKDEILATVWAGVTVGEDSLAQCITEIRRALGPTGRDVIKTVQRRGYLLSIPRSSQDESAPRGAQAPDALPLPDRPSIAVLPFANLGGQPQDDYFSDGIAEDITTELSRFSELFVIARNSSFQYNGKSIDVRQVGRELGVRYVLEGSVRREATRVRITAQLIEAATGMHLWAERYDRQLADALSVQDEVARQIVTVLAVHVRKADNSARLWDTATGQQVSVLQGHADIVLNAAFSPDGRRIATASSDSNGRIWDAATGQEIAALQGHADRVLSVAFSSDGRRIVTASDDNSARIWDAKTGQQVAALQGHTSPVWTATFSPDGQRIVTASPDCAFRRRRPVVPTHGDHLFRSMATRVA